MKTRGSYSYVKFLRSVNIKKFDLFKSLIIEVQIKIVQ